MLLPLLLALALARPTLAAPPPHPPPQPHDPSTHPQSPHAAQQREWDTLPFLVAPIQLYGLANRLRALEMAHILATRAGRRLAVHWIPATDCAVQFRELFDVDALAAAGVLVDVSGDSHLRCEFVPDDSEHVFRLQSNIPVVPTTRRDVWNTSAALALLSSSRVPMALEAWHIARPVDMDCQSYFTHRSHLLKSLVPVGWIRETVEGFVSEHMRFRLTVGVHVRMDREFDDPCIPYGGKDGPYSSFEEFAPLGKYEQVCSCA